jgi:multiple sugar transport system ATP-binding protein
VRYEAVTKRFDAVEALKALDLEVPDGSFCVLLGPSGCGKTTALRILAGLETPTAGRVLIGDRDVTRVQPRDRDIAMVFQSYALYPHMTVRENIAYPLRIRGMSKADRAAAVERVATALEVSHLLERRPKQLSGGQRQRIALARAIVREPAVFLMDEPLSNLDAKLRASARGEIKRLQKRLATTTLYVTHDQAEAMTMADRVAVMRDGELQQVAPPHELYDLPANRFVATFVGSPPMNVVVGSLDRDTRSFAVGSSRIPLGERFEEVAGSEAVELGVRPEDLRLAPAGGIGLAGEVYVVEPMGNETLVDVVVADSRMMVRAPRAFDAEVGTAVTVEVDVAAATFFAADERAVAHRLDRSKRPNGGSG